MGFVLAAAFALSLQTFLTRRNRKLKDATLKALSKLAFILPDSHEERSWFAVVSITRAFARKSYTVDFCLDTCRQDRGTSISGLPWQFRASCLG
jgi:hypothetical protein